MSPSVPLVPPATDRLVFRAWVEEDAPLARDLWGDADVMRLMGGPLDEERILLRLRTEIERQRTLGFSYWPMFERDGTHLGCAGLKPYPEAGVLETGFHLLPRAWGRGLAQEAARAVARHAFGVLGVAELFAGHHPENHASKRVLQKIGFVYDRDELYPPTGLMHPGYRLRASSFRTPDES